MYREVKANGTMSQGILGNGGSWLSRRFSVIETNSTNSSGHAQTL